MTEKIKSLKLIHLAICAGTIIAYVIIGGKIPTDKLIIDHIDSSEMVYAAIPLFAFVLSNFLFKMQLKQIDSKLELEQKLPAYISASIIRWAVLEASAFVILFLKQDFIIFGVLIILYLAFLRPTEERANNDLQNIA